MKRLFVSIARLLSIGCVPTTEVRTEGTAPIAPEVAPTASDSASPASPTASPADADSDDSGRVSAADLPRSALRDIERVFDKPVVFIASGREGRMGVIADEAGQAVPWTFERGSWKRLPLPDAHAAPIAKLRAGIYFGRDDRPRLMGYVTDGDGVRMLYLRFKGGAWRPEPKEIGRLGKAPPAELFGVLGWDDPEVVCKAGDVCLIKSRKGWQEVKPTIVANARVRAFGGKGYAATADGVYRADEKGFVRMGPGAPWTTAPAGFWVDADGDIVVTEPATNEIHALDAKAGAWTSTDAPIAGPQDVTGPASTRIVVGAGGMARFENGAWHRVGETSWSLRFAWVDGEPASAVVAAGESGVFRMRVP